MSMITVDLKQFKREIEASLKRDITWAEIHEKTGLAQTTINRWMNQEPQRVDLDAINKLCKFFNVPPGPVPFIIYQPTETKKPPGGGLG